MTRTRPGFSRFCPMAPATRVEDYVGATWQGPGRLPGSVLRHERCDQHRGTGGRRADLGGPRRGRRRLRRPLRAPRRGRPTPRPAARAGRRRRRPGVRGLRQGAGRAAARRRARRGLPRLPPDLRPAPPGRPHPGDRAAAHHRRHGGLRPRRAVRRHGRRGLRERGRGPGVRLAARALAAGALAHRGRGRQARRHRADPRHERQLGLRPRLPCPRGPARGVPDPARRRARGRHLPLDPRPAGCLRPLLHLPSRRRARSRTTSTSAVRAWPSTSS